MLFYSNIYLFLFLPVTLFFYFFRKYLKLDHKTILIFCGLFFYSWWNYKYLPLILFIVFVNYYFSLKILATKGNRLLLFSSILFNVLNLVIFKYLDFLILNLNNFFNLNLTMLNLPFPLALSFITFQVIAMLINCYDEEIQEVKLKDFFVFIIFFPQLIAGPIVKFNFMIKQFNNNLNLSFNLNNFNIGIFLILIGLVKKVLLAENLGTFVDYGYQNIQQLNIYLSWLLSFSFTFQLYFDFSGYIDMATGSALLFNIILPKNFNSPLKAYSIIDFWKRWHITLGEFLTNYIYSPWAKSINNLNFFKSMYLIIIVFLIAGIWHGPTWCFVIFGLIHGFGLVINHTFRKYNFFKINILLACFITFNFVNFSFIFFRSKSFSDAFSLLKKMFNFNSNFDFSENIILYEILDLKFYLVFISAVLITFIGLNSYNIIEKFKQK